jgi:HlyD family secretion protein
MSRNRPSLGLMFGVIGLVLLPACGRTTRDEDEASRKPQANQRPSRTAAGDPIVRLDAAAQTRVGLRTEVVKTQTLRPELIAYGRLEADPSRAFVLRAAVAGTLRVTAGSNWPRLGESLGDGAIVGAIEPRLAPAEQIGLTNQLAGARADLAAAASSVTAARAAFERARVLNADNKNVSDRALEEATARVASEEARFKTASETVNLLEASLHSTGPGVSRSLTVERGGEVVEIMAQPGEAIEPGAPIVRVVKLDRLLARVDVPVGEHLPPNSSTARIMAVGFEDSPIAAERVGVSATTEPTAQGQSFLFRLRSTLFGLRPGVAVTARIPAAGPSRTGVDIPTAAIVRVEGQAYVFVQTAAEEFVRRPISLDQPTEAGYLAAASVAAGDRIVVQGAQMLLSEEFKSRIATEG